MNEHILSEVADHNRWLVHPKPMIDAGMATSAIGIVLHQSTWNALPISTLWNVLVAFQYERRVSSHQVIAAPVKVPAQAAIPGEGRLRLEGSSEGCFECSQKWRYFAAG
jgi:hypothetical protein